MAMLLLQAALPKLPPAQLSLALGPALLRTLVDALEGTDRFLRPVAEDTVKGIVAAAQQNAQLRASLVSQLLGRPSASSTTADADAAPDDDAAADGDAADGAERPAKKSGGSAGMQRSTAARALRQLMSQGLDPGGASEYTGYLIARFCKTSSPGTASEDGPAPTAEEDAAAREVRTERAWVLEQLFTLAKGRLARRPPAAAAAAAAPAADGDGDASKKRRRGDDDAPAAADAAAAAAACVRLPDRTMRFFFRWAYFDAELPKFDSRAAKLTAAFGGAPAAAPTPAEQRVCGERFWSLLAETGAALAAAPRGCAVVGESGEAIAGGAGASGAGGGGESTADLWLLSVVRGWWAELTKGGAKAVTPLSAGGDRERADAFTKLLETLGAARAARPAAAAAASAAPDGRGGGGMAGKLDALELLGVTSSSSYSHRRGRRSPPSTISTRASASSARPAPTARRRCRRPPPPRTTARARRGGGERRPGRLGRGGRREAGGGGGGGRPAPLAPRALVA